MQKKFRKEESLKIWLSQGDDLEVAALEGGMTEIGIPGGEAAAAAEAEAGVGAETETGITAVVALSVAVVLSVALSVAVAVVLSVAVVVLLVTTSAAANIVNHQVGGV